MKICKKCGKVFPSKIKIENKWKNIKSRSYCLECSEFGKHNTKKLEHEIILENEDGKVCSKCGNRKKIEDFHKQKGRNCSSWCKICLYENQMNRWKDRKRKAVELMGGSCQNKKDDGRLCGYRKSMAALEFHHLDRREKDFDWTHLGKRKWDVIINELKKCILVCANCHREIHSSVSPQSELLNDNNRLNKVLKPTGVCPNCKGETFGTKYCSVECSNEGNRKIKNRPSKDELAALLKEHSYCEVGRMYRVSDTAIRKWLR